MAVEVTTPTDRHGWRNLISVFASTTETIRTLEKLGRLDLSGFPSLRQQIEDCHSVVMRLKRESDEEGKGVR